MSLADKSHDAIVDWALDELKQISQRNFELAKFFFAVSAASFAIVPTSNMKIQQDDWWHLFAVLPLAGSLVLAIMMAQPASFRFNAEINFEEQHRKFACRLTVIRRLWIVSWLIGVILTLLVFGDVIEPSSAISKASINDVWNNG